MIQVNDVSKVIRKKQVLKNITLTIEEGKVYGLSGPNGSGKTMLLRLLCDLIRPTSGTVVRPPDITYGVVIETPGFLFGETGKNNLKYLASINHKIDDQAIDAVLQKVGLFDAKDIKVKKYSLGMIQKLGIAQAIMETPKLLLLDEPFNALDENSIENMQMILKDMAENGTTMVIAAHNLDFIIDLCTHHIKMNEGEIVGID